MSGRAHRDASRPQVAEPDRATTAREAAPVAADAGADRVLALQRAAGNAAVGRVLARDVNLFPSVDPNRVPPPSAIGVWSAIGPKAAVLPYTYTPVPPMVDSCVRQYLQTHRVAIGDRAHAGQTSMPEVIAELRQQVPAAVQVEAWQLEPIVRDVLGADTPPATRGRATGDGIAAELEASIANSFPKPPTSVRLSNRAGSLELSVSGIEIRTRVAGAKVTVEAEKEGASTTVAKDGVSVTAEGSFKGDSLGLKTKVGDISFGAKLEKDKGTWSKWSMSLNVPLIGQPSGGPVPSDKLHDAVIKAHEAVGRVVSHLAAGGSVTDDVVKDALGDIKPAIEGVSKAMDKPKGPSASIGVNAGGGASGITAGVTLTVTF